MHLLTDFYRSEIHINVGIPVFSNTDVLKFSNDVAFVLHTRGCNFQHKLHCRSWDMDIAGSINVNTIATAQEYLTMLIYEQVISNNTAQDVDVDLVLM